MSTELNKKEGTEKEVAETERFGIKLSDITPGVLADIYRIYDETVGGKAAAFTKDDPASLFMAQARGGGSVDLRFGSRLTGESKFKAITEYSPDDTQVLVFKCYANINPQSDLNKQQEAEALEKAFETAANEYIKNSGFGVKLEK